MEQKKELRRVQCDSKSIRVFIPKGMRLSTNRENSIKAIYRALQDMKQDAHTIYMNIGDDELPGIVIHCVPDKKWDEVR